MRIPNVLSSLVDEGVIERVVRPLMSGKEAQVYLVVAGGIECVAKIYKEAENRTFKHRADYTEGRKVRNSRDQRAINKRSQHGRSQDESAWRSTEVDMIYRLRAAGVRVPAPYHFIDGVLVMELVSDANGDPAARLGELDFTPDEARGIYQGLLQDVVRMLCAGVVHGDLSDFNVLLGADGPVIIDFPQAVDPSKNQNARKLLLRDVENLHRFYSKFVPEEPRAPYAEEMWALYESNRLTPETRLRGQYRASQKKANVAELMDFIGEVNEDERRRRRAQGRDASAIPAPPRGVDPRDQPRPAAGPKPAAAGPRQAQLPPRSTHVAAASGSDGAQPAPGQARARRRRPRGRPPANPGAAPPANRSAAPPANRSAAPPANRGAAPPANRSAAPPANRSAAPPANRGAAPPANRSAAPPANRSAAPPANRGAAPPVNRSAAPFANRGAAPPANRGAAPPANRSAAPPANRGAAPPANRSAAPPANRGAAPLANRGAALLANRGAAPPANRGVAPLAPASRKQEATPLLQPSSRRVAPR